MVFFQESLWAVIMDAFLQRHRTRIVGVLSGCDRVLFRGTLRSISYLDGMERLLASHRILYTQFSAFVQRVSDRLKQHAQQLAEKHQRPFIYLQSAALSKEDTARNIMERDGIRQGLVCVLSCVEPCQTYALKKDGQKKHLLLVPAERKCLHLYFYFVDREFGLIHVRLQTWLPMSIQVCVNGREYLARRLDRAGIGCEKRDNCFVRIDDLPRAQEMMDVGEPSPTRHLLDPVSKRITRRGRPYRALRPIDPEEAKLFAVLTDGQFLLQGFRNCDLRERLIPQTPHEPDQARKASGQISRRLRLLRAHGLVRKVTGTFYYRITKRGHHVMATALKLRQSCCLAAAA